MPRPPNARRLGRPAQPDRRRRSWPHQMRPRAWPGWPQPSSHPTRTQIQYIRNRSPGSFWPSAGKEGGRSSLTPCRTRISSSGSARRPSSPCTPRPAPGCTGSSPTRFGCASRDYPSRFQRGWGIGSTTSPGESKGWLPPAAKGDVGEMSDGFNRRTRLRRDVVRHADHAGDVPNNLVRELSKQVH